MTRESDEERDERITNEVIVDAYTTAEQAFGWYYYLERRLRFPFQMGCVEERMGSPLREGEQVCVIGMADESDCTSEMVVLVECLDRVFGVPLSQLEVREADSDTREAVEDWHYWNGDRGRLH